MKTLEKSIWLETGNVIPKHIVQLFEDLGIEDNHEVFTNINSSDKNALIDKINASEQICFESSLVGKSLEMIEDLVVALGYMGTRNKRFVVLAELLYALNSGYILPKSSTETTFFNNNEVYQLEEGKLERVVYDYDMKKFKFL